MMLPAVWEGEDVPDVGLDGIIPLQQSIKGTIEATGVNTSERKTVPAEIPPWRSMEDIFKDLIDPLYENEADDMRRLYRATLRSLDFPLVATKKARTNTPEPH